jgi:hypothetical protein
MKARMWWLRQILDAALVEIHRLMIEASLDVYALLVAHLTQARTKIHQQQLHC